MTVILNWILTLVLRFRYPAVFAVAVLGSFDVPIPTSAVLMASAFFASSGYLNFFAVLAVSAVGSVLGDNAVYWLARHFGPRLDRVPGLRRRLESPWFKRVERDVTDHPALTICLGQFSPGLAPGFNLLAGLGRMRYARFLAFEATGSCAATAVNAFLGFLFGSNWQYLDRIFGRSVEAIVIALLFIYVALWRRAARRRRRRREPDGDPGVRNAGAEQSKINETAG